MSLKERIKRHEGLRLKPYTCSAGKLTIGYGRNLEVGITGEEADFLFENDLLRARALAEQFPAYERMDDIRRGVLIEMVFQMGFGGVSKFKRFLSAAQNEDWPRAADEMLDSEWAKQTPERARELARLMLRGVSER